MEQPLPAERHRRIDEVVEIHRVVDLSPALIPTPVAVEAGIDVLVADGLRAAARG